MLKPQIINLLDEFSRETYIPKEDLFKVLERAFQMVAKMKYGQSRNIKVTVNRLNATPTFYYGVKVVESSNPGIDEISLTEAKKIDEDIEINEVLMQKLPSFSMTREYMQAIQKFFISEVEGIKLDRQYQEFSARIGDIFQVVIRHIDRKSNNYATAIVSIDGHGEGTLKTIPGEVLQVKERVFAQLIEVTKPNPRSKIQENQLIFTRTSEDFVAKLLEKNVLEIREKTVEIVAIARFPGFKTKVAVCSTEIGKYGKTDPVYPCIGPNGIIVKEISKELGGEKVDIFRWSDDIKELITNALHPVVPFNINIMNHVIEVVVADAFIGPALGSHGKNIRLISHIVGKKVNVFTQDQIKINKERAEQSVESLKELLSLDDLTARLLVMNGYNKPLDIINDPNGLYDLGLKDEVISDTVTNAKYIYALSVFEELSISQDLFDLLQSLDVDELLRCIKLAEAKITTIHDFCRLSVEDFKKIVFDTELNDDEIEDLLMAADNTESSEDSQNIVENEELEQNATDDQVKKDIE